LIEVQLLSHVNIDIAGTLCLHLKLHRKVPLKHYNENTYPVMSHLTVLLCLVCAVSAELYSTAFDAIALSYY